MNTLAALAVLLVTSTTSTSVASPWDGTWKLDRAKSHLVGTTITLSKVKGDKWKYDDGTVSYEFALDGKPVHTIADGTMSATADGDHALNLVFKSKGTESKMHLVLSADGKTLTDHSTGTRPDGSKVESSGTSARVGAGSGFAGTWRSTKTESNTAESFALTATGDHIKWEWPAYKRMAEGKLDGSNIPITGAAGIKGATMAVKKASASKLTYVVKFEGKTVSEGMLELSADGKTLTDTSWAPAKPKEKTIAVYTK